MRTLDKVTILDSDELDKLVNELYSDAKAEYSSIEHNEWKNDAKYFVEGVNGQIKSYEIDWIKQWAGGAFHSIPVRLMLNALVKEGKLEPSNYVISVCW